MYFNPQTLIDVLSDEAVAGQAAVAIEADRKRITSPLAVVEAVLALSASGKSLEEAEALVTAFLDEKDIEVREMPPANKMVRLALAAVAELDAADNDRATASLHKAFADYYEVAAFSLSDALAADAPDTNPEG